MLIVKECTFICFYTETASANQAFDLCYLLHSSKLNRQEQFTLTLPDKTPIEPLTTTLFDKNTLRDVPSLKYFSDEPVIVERGLYRTDKTHVYGRDDVLLKMQNIQAYVFKQSIHKMLNAPPWRYVDSFLQIFGDGDVYNHILLIGKVKTPVMYLLCIDHRNGK